MMDEDDNMQYDFGHISVFGNKVASALVLHSLKRAWPNMELENEDDKIVTKSYSYLLLSSEEKFNSEFYELAIDSKFARAVDNLESKFGRYLLVLRWLQVLFLHFAIYRITLKMENLMKKFVILYSN